MLKRFMLGHASWQALHPGARCIYIELRRRFNGSNNGEISLSCREAAIIAHCGKSTASKLFDELETHGYIKPAAASHFRNRWATTWILTNESYNGQSPTHEWAKWHPQN